MEHKCHVPTRYNGHLAVSNKKNSGDAVSADDYEVPKEIVTQAEEFWDIEGIPLLRDPMPGEKVLILGWSRGQELPVLLSSDTDSDDDYGVQSSAEAANILPDDLPRNFTCEGIAVAKLGRGFYDGNCDEFTEITFPSYWHATLLQCWMDANGVPICIRPSSAMQDDKIISDHVALANFSYDRTMKYAAFKGMSIRGEIRRYVGECWRSTRTLPQGTQRLPSGTEVTFLGPDDLFLDSKRGKS